MFMIYLDNLNDNYFRKDLIKGLFSIYSKKRCELQCIMKKKISAKCV